MQFSENISSEVENLSWEIAERDPRKNLFGFYHYGDRAASQGGGTSVFMWFPTEDERQDFLVRCLPYMHMDCRDQKDFDQRTALLLGTLSNLGDDQFPAAYNAEMKGVAQVEWIGTLQDLLESNATFAARTRREFREGGATNKAPDSPILDNELGDFIEFTQVMGI